MTGTVVFFTILAFTLLQHASLVAVHIEAFDFVFIVVFLLNIETETPFPLLRNLVSTTLLRSDSLIVELVILFAFLVTLNDELALTLLALARVPRLPFELLRHIFASALLASDLPLEEVAPTLSVNFDTVARGKTEGKTYLIASASRSTPACFMRVAALA
jgi:hypothetical protein